MICINNEGLSAMGDFLKVHHTRGHLVTPANVFAWVDHIETHHTEGETPHCEVRSIDSLSGRPEVFFFSPEHYTVT